MSRQPFFKIIISANIRCLKGGKSKGGTNAMTVSFRTVRVIALKIGDHDRHLVLNLLEKPCRHCSIALAPGHLCVSQHARPARSSSKSNLRLVMTDWREKSVCVCVKVYYAWEWICACSFSVERCKISRPANHGEMQVYPLLQVCQDI